jgi:hypothetical protein
VCSLTNASLTELHVVNHSHWVDPGDDNELLKVATRKMFTLSSDPNEWDTPILWGHEQTGPFTILEGNHRLTAYAATSREDLRIPVFVGLSSTACYLHLPDHTDFLLYDMFPQHPEPDQT